MGMRIVESRAAEPHEVEMAETEAVRVEEGVLPGEDDAQRQSARGQCLRYGFELDRFRSGADDERNVTAAQLSP